MCPKRNDTRNSLSKKSYVEDFEGVPELFNVLVSSPADDVDYNWNIFTFPIDFDTVLSGPKLERDLNYFSKYNYQFMYTRTYFFLLNSDLLF